MMKLMIERKGNVRSYRVRDLNTANVIIDDPDSVSIGSRVVVVQGNKILLDRVVG